MIKQSWRGVAALLILVIAVMAGDAIAADHLLTGRTVRVPDVGENKVRVRCLASPITPRPVKGVSRVHPWSLPTTAMSANAVADTINVLVLRYNFQYETTDDPNTTGRGQMDFSRPLANPTDSAAYYNSVGHLIDPPPHNADYFNAHMQAMGRFWNTVSEGKIAIKWDIYPPVNDSAYLLPHKMSYYGLCDSVVVGLERFFEDGIRLADTVHRIDPNHPVIDFTKYDEIVMFHAGSDRQNDIGFPPTCSDLFTGFIKFGDSVPVNDSAKFIREALLMPETSCQDQRATALNAAFAHEFGHALGLVDLYNTNNFLSQLGDFSLMDDNGFGTGIDFGFTVGQVFGAIPIYPDAWSRAYLGYVPVVDFRQGSDLRIVAAEIASSGIKIARVPISENQYYLIENRNQETDGQVTYARVDSLTGVIQGPVNVSRNYTGEYDFLIPGSGMLIYLVDEGVAALNYTGDGSNNFDENTLQWDPSRKFITLIEGDGVVNFGGYYRSGFGKAEDMYRDDRNNAFTPNTNPQALDNFHNNTRVYMTDIRRDTVLEPGAVEYTMVDSVMRFDLETDKLATGFPVRVGYPKYGLAPIVDDLRKDGQKEIIVASGRNVTAFTTTGQRYLACSGGGCQSFFDSAFSSTNPGTPHLMPMFYRSPSTVTAGPVAGHFADDSSHDVIAIGDSSGIVRLLSPFDNNADGIADFAGSDMPAGGTPIALCFGGNTLWTLSSTIDTGWVFRRVSPFDPYANRRRFAGISEFHGIAQLGSRLGLLGGDSLTTHFYVMADNGTDSLQVDSLSVAGHYNFGPIVVDVNRDGVPEVVAFSSTGDGIYVSVDTSNISASLSVLVKKSTGYTFTTNPVAGDIDRDGRADVVIAGKNALYAFDERLTLKTDFPRACNDRVDSLDITAAPVIGQADGQDGPEMICPNQLGNIHAIAASEIAGFPLNGGVNGAGSCLLITDSGRGELGYVGADGWFYLWHIDGDSTKNFWPMGGHDPAGSFAITQSQIGPVQGFADIFPKAKFYNYPNPATSGSTTIRYFLGKQASRVMLTLYDLSGRKINEFAGATSIGDNEQIWNCGDVTPGVYRCRIEVDFSGDTRTAFTDIAVIR